MDFGSPPIVLECGSGYTKMGFAGNNRPSFVMPTSVASSSGSELTVLIGNDAELAGLHGYHVTHPVSNGVIQDWDAMERFWQQSFYRWEGMGGGAV